MCLKRIIAMTKNKARELRKKGLHIFFFFNWGGGGGGGGQLNLFLMKILLHMSSCTFIFVLFFYIFSLILV